MKRKLAYSPDIIDYIHNSSKKFVEDNYSDETLFFDEFWKIYELQLKKWTEKQPRRWRLKVPKSKHPKFLSISGGKDALDLVTPKVIEAVSASFFQIAGIKEKVSIDLVEDVISNCGRRLSDELKAQIKDFFAPIIIRDLKMMRGMQPEKEIKEEVLVEAQIDSVRAMLPPKSAKEKNEYWIYSHEKPTKPFPASKREVDELENLSLEEKGKRFDIFFSEEKNEAITQGIVKDFSSGKKEATQLKKLIYLFLSHVGSFVEFLEINDVVWGEQLQTSPAIHQLKDRLIKFIGEAINPFIKSGKRIVDKDNNDDQEYLRSKKINENDSMKSDRYYIKETYRGRKFKYCMIIRMESVKDYEY
jgi:hypothetical protein